MKHKAIQFYFRPGYMYEIHFFHARIFFSLKAFYFMHYLIVQVLQCFHHNGYL